MPPWSTEPLAMVLGNLGGKQGSVVDGEGSFDEISIVGPTRVSQLKDGAVTTYDIAPEDFGMTRAKLSDFKGGDVFDNARIVKKVLAGEGGPREDMVALNAAAAFIAAGGGPQSPRGIELARETIRTGRALAKLEALIDKSKIFWDRAVMCRAGTARHGSMCALRTMDQCRVRTVDHLQSPVVGGHCPPYGEMAKTRNLLYGNRNLIRVRFCLPSRSLAAIAFPSRSLGLRR